MTDELLPLFGELYLRSTRPFLSDAVTAREIEFLSAVLPPGRVLDVGCGHGRHLGAFGQRGVGLDFDAVSLEEARHVGRVTRADFTRMPFRSGQFGAAFAWYNAFGTLSDDEFRQALTEVARCLQPGGLLVVQGTNPEMAKAQPLAQFDRQLPDGSHLFERTHWNAHLRRDEIERTLTLPDNQRMATSFFIRYFELSEWKVLLEGAGLSLQWSCGGVDYLPVGTKSNDVIVGALKRG